MENKKPKIQPGYLVGKLTVLEPTAERKSGYTVWRCRCDCGGEIALDTRTLQRGTVKDCGCETRVKPGVRDLTGQRFGRLLVLEATDKRTARYGRVVWLCRCDCGKLAEVSANQLLAGYSKSCGCLGRPPLKDFEGRRFGRLTVLSYAGKDRGMHRWLCRCDCGKETVVGQSLLQSGKTRSCGCLNDDRLLESMGLADGTSVRVLEYFQQHLSARNTSGCNGVYQNKRTGKWVAQITFRGKTKYLGSFQKKEEAVRARLRAEECIDDFLEDYYRNNPDWPRPEVQKPATSA